MGFPVGSDGKEFACNIGDMSSIPGFGRSPGGGAWQPTPVSLAGEFPWTEEPGGLQSVRLQRVRYDKAAKHFGEVGDKREKLSPVQWMSQRNNCSNLFGTK